MTRPKFDEPLPGEASFPYNEAGRLQMIAARKDWVARRDAFYVANGFLQLPSGPHYLVPNDGRIDIEAEDGTLLLSFQSFDEYSGIECTEGTLQPQWEAAEVAESLRRSAKRSPVSDSRVQGE